MDQVSRFVQTLFALVEQDRLQESLDALRAFYQLAAAGEETEVIILKNRLSTWETEKNAGLKPDPTERLRIAHSITLMVRAIEQDAAHRDLDRAKIAAITPVVRAGKKGTGGRAQTLRPVLIGMACLSFIFGIQYLWHWAETYHQKLEASLATFDVLILPFSSYASDGSGNLAVEKALMDRMKAIGEKNGLPLTVNFHKVAYSLKNPLDAAKARRTGLKQWADLVIWGDYEKQAGWDSTLFNFRYVYLDSTVYQAPFGSKGETGFQSANSLAALNAGAITGRIEDMVYWSFGMRAFSTGDYAASKNLLLKVQARKDRAFSDVLFFIAYACSELGKKDSAMLLYNQALALNPEDPDSYNNRGNLFLNSNRVDSALADYEKAIRFKGDESIFWANRGNALQIKGKYAEAMRHYNRSIELDPARGITYRIRATLFAALDSPRAALRDLDTAFARGYEDAHLYYLRANLLFNADDYPAALSDYHRAVALDSTAEHLNGRANCYRLQGDYVAALADLQAAVSLDSNFSLAYGTRAEVYAQRGETEAFYAEITRALDKGCPVWDFIQDPAYDNYRDTPRFQTLLESYQTGS